ncbi:tyrosine-protein phosphatase [Nocardioides sp.]|uniref:tyrosine-protein phosphatase n=1 Tax=Nocardioides sp. TaxID=35761 RepID=UPI0037849C90
MHEVSDGPAWEGARNLADLGGLPRVAGGSTARGRVFRSAAPEWMTSQGWAAARAAGLTTVVDLRNGVERRRRDVHPVLEPDAMAGVTVVHAPTEDPDDAEFLAECGPWLDHPRSWAPNLRFYPDKLGRVFAALAGADGPVLVHCAGGRDRTGMVGSMLLALAGVTPDGVVAAYEAGFRGAAGHRGHGLAYDPGTGSWVTAADESWTEDELVAALDDRRPVLLAWLAETDVAAYLAAAGVTEADLARLERLLVD